MRKKAFILFLASILLVSSCCPAVYADEQGGKNSFTVVKDLPYDSVGEFSEGYAVAKKDAAGGAKYGLIDISGNEIVAPKYDYMQEVHEGMAVIGTNTDGNRSTGTDGIDKYGFVNTKGAEVVAPVYDTVYRFSEGRAAVADKYVSGTVTWGSMEMPVVESRLGFIDKTGKVVIPMEYSGCESVVDGTHGPKYSGFSDGLACVSKDGNYGAIDVNGNTVIPFSFQRLESFHEGLACYSDYSGNKKGFVDKTGKTVFSLNVPSDTSIGFFSNGLCRVYDNYHNWQSAYPKNTLIDKKRKSCFLARARFCKRVFRRDGAC